MDKKNNDDLGVTMGLAAESASREYEVRIGIARDVSSSARPLPGYVVHPAQIEEKRKKALMKKNAFIPENPVFELGDEDEIGDGLTAFGEIELILKPEVAERTAYGVGDPMVRANRPVLLSSTDRDEIVDAITNGDGIGADGKNTEQMLNMISASLNKNWSRVNKGADEQGRLAGPSGTDREKRAHESLQALIAGGINISDVEGIHYPYSRIVEAAKIEEISDVVNYKSVSDSLQKAGFTPEEMQYFYTVTDDGEVETPSMKALREYRAAQKVKSKYEKAGIGYVKIAHPDGMDIDDPRTYDRTSVPTEKVENVLKEKINSEMNEFMSRFLKQMRSGQDMSRILG